MLKLFLPQKLSVCNIIFTVAFVFILAMPNLVWATEQVVSYDQTLPVQNRQLIQKDNVSGSLIYEYPLEIPSGRNGMQPDLSLIYNSNSVNNSGMFGQGWSVGIPYIERINKDGADKMYNEDYYYSSIDGELRKIEDEQMEAMTGGVEEENLGVIDAYDIDEAGKKEKLSLPEQMVKDGKAEKAEDGSIIILEPEELAQKRGSNSKSFLSGWDAKGITMETTRFYGNDVHYYDDVKKEYLEIDTKVEDIADGWKMDKAPYGAIIKKNPAKNFITFINKSQELYFSAVNANEAVAGIKDVGDKLWANKQVVYQDALGKDMDLQVRLTDSALNKEIVIKNQNVLGNLNDSSNQYYEFEFILTANNQIDLEIDGQMLSKVGAIVSSSLAKIADSNGTASYILPPVIRDSSANGNYQSIQIRYELKADGVHLTKLIPVEYLRTAAYPVITDATVSYNVGGGDGYVRKNNSASWETTHDATSGQNVEYLETLNSVGSYHDGSYYYMIQRSFFPIDTSDLPDDANINAAKFYFTVESVAKEAGYVGLIQTSQTSTGTLSLDDYDSYNIATGAPDLYIDSTNQYHFSLNATGKSWINPTGWTKLGIFDKEYDLDDTVPGVDGTYFQIWSASATESADRPYLEIVHLANEGPSESTDLLTNGEINPDLTATTVDFSAIYDDANLEDEATDYQIQVSTVSNDWDEPVWDSGKTVFVNPLVEGNRSEVIAYGGDELVAYIIYYWRIKLWDDDDAEGDWSTETASFQLVTDLYGVKIDSGAYNKYEKNDDYWIITDKQGTVYKYGYSVTARQDDNSHEKTYKWMLEEARDTNGNSIKYQYYKDEGQIYPEYIRYTDHNNTSYLFTVYFEREDSYDDLKQYHSGFNVETNVRISTVKVYVDNDLVRQYDLDYTTGDNGSRSFLETITKSGIDEQSNTITLPANTFAYQTKTQGWTQDQDYTSLTVPMQFGGSANSYSDTEARIADINGDGLVDLLWSGPSDHRVYLNDGNGSSWTLNTTWNIPVEFGSGQLSTGAVLIDVNGDGYPDIVGPNEGDESFVRLNNHSTGWPTIDYNYNVPVVLTGSDLRNQFAEVNGDGFPDIIHCGWGTSCYVYINQADGTGWEVDNNYTVPLFFSANSPQEDMGVRIGDVNGDGLDDLLRAYDNNGSIRSVYVNKGDGTGWFYNSVLTDSLEDLQLHFKEFNIIDNGVRLADFNGDNFVDIIETKTMYLNNADGTGWTSDGEWTLDMAGGVSGNSTRLADINGDGLIDVIFSEMIQGEGLLVKGFIANDHKADLLYNIQTETGVEMTAEYLSTPQYLDDNDDLLNPDCPYVLQTLKTLTTDDGNDVVSATTYEYQGGDYYYGNELDRRFGGFGKIKETNDVGNYVLNYYHQGNNSNSSTGEYSDDQSKIGRAYRTEQYNADDELYTKTINKWENYDLGNDRDFVYKTRVTEVAYDGDNDHEERANTFAYDTDTGNLIENINYGVVDVSADDGSFTDTGTDESTTTIEYAINSDAYILGLPQNKITTDQSNDKVSEARYYYDSQSLGDVNIGNLTKEEYWVDTVLFVDNYIDIEHSYNGYGLTIQDKDPLDNTIDYVYDTYNLYPTTVTNAMEQETTYEYDYSNGKPKQMTDVNGRVYQTIYDGLDRVKELKQPDLENPELLMTKTTYTYVDTVGSRSVQEDSYLDASNIVSKYVYLDGFDRPIQERKEAEASNTFLARDFAYNEQGLLEKESLPYESTGTSKTTATTTANLYTNYTYDPLNRPTAIVNAVGITTYVYDDWKTTITDAENNEKSIYVDARGNLSRVDEKNDTNTYTTEYEYNLQNKLTQIEDHYGNIRNFTYDGLGRQLTAQDLHDPQDQAYGTITYTYDNANNLISKLDANNHTVNYTYDDLNRILTEDFTGVSGTEISYTYDDCDYGIGRLCLVEMSENGTVREYVYNPLGGRALETIYLTSDEYEYGIDTQYTYDRQGNITIVKYPDASYVRYTYNNGGLAETLEFKDSGEVSYNTYIEDVDYNPLNQFSYMQFANGRESVWTYDPDELYRLHNKTTSIDQGETTTVRFYPLAADGYLKTSNPSWDTGHDATTADYLRMKNYAEINIGVGENEYEEDEFEIYRGFLTFDTSALPDGVDINSANLKVNIAGVDINDGNQMYDWVTVVEGQLANPTYPALGDFDAIGDNINNPTEGVDSRATLTNLSTKIDQYHSFNLNTTGISWIDDQGYTMLGLREGHDVMDVPYNGIDDEYDMLYIWSLDKNDTALDPYLEITFDGAPEEKIEDSTYTYDNVGNITQIVDDSDTALAKTLDFAYDDLYRLTNATKLGDYDFVYTYDSIGNIISNSALGAYSYDETGYANPNAMTEVNDITYGYDNNGNMIDDEDWGYTYNYRNNLIQAYREGSPVSVYSYDHENSRVHKNTGSDVRFYPSKYSDYGNISSDPDGNNESKYAYINNVKVMEMADDDLICYIHSDHPGSTKLDKT